MPPLISREEAVRLGAMEDRAEIDGEANFWSPERQLRRRKKKAVPPRPDGAANTYPEVVHVAGWGD